MPIVIFLILAGAWAAFLLPSFLDSRKNAPLTSTQQFDRSLARLASVQGFAVDPDALSRRLMRARRRRVLIALAVTAVGTLAAAVILASVELLLLHLAVDALGAIYVAVLIQLRRRSRPVMPLDAHEEPAAQILASG